ncbi:MAG TPA: hypothetical protein VF017_23575 [Thermoanaerobaculia bacterium]|nr:hypothetical protein [Thermoanaerobaculia bacterium]
MKKTRSIWVLALLVAASPAFAETFTVTLKGGGQFISRHQPETAAWDANTILVLGDQGNWIALDRADVKSISSSVENRGFGVRLDTNTIFLGWSSNDGNLPPGEGEYEDQLPQERSNTAEQFIDPEDFGKAGLPVYLGVDTSSRRNNSGSQGGGGGVTPAPQQAPAATPPPSSSTNQ